MKIQIAIIATAILATLLIATPILNNSLIKTASAKTSHQYCFEASSVSTSFGSCYDRIGECQAGEVIADQLVIDGDVSITKQCYHYTNSDKTTNNWCFDLLPNDGQSCSGSKKECESFRESFKASRVGYRTGSECYKI